MLRADLTNCTGMPMSEADRLQPSGARLAHAAEVARWSVMLLGWLWLGEQGMRLGWSWASGVVAVALWWAVRIACRGRSWRLKSPALLLGVCGLSTALGACLIPWLSDRAMAHGALLLVAVLWGVWSALLEARSQTANTFLLGTWAWHPLLAAALVMPMLQVSGLAGPFGAACLLALCAALLSAHEILAPLRAAPCAANALPGPALLAPSAMGLMMGSLWLGGNWCTGLGWSFAHTIWAHLGLMTVLPAVLGLVLRALPIGRVLLEQHTAICGILMTVAALLLLGNPALHGLLAMVLLCLAWALHCVHEGMRAGLPQRHPLLWSAWPRRGAALLLGPLLLFAVGVTAPSAGPAAVQSALFALGLLAGLGLLWKHWPRPDLRKPLPAITFH
jgi:hypothetical protein